jgi:hypothetical protein
VAVSAELIMGMRAFLPLLFGQNPTPENHAKLHFTIILLEFPVVSVPHTILSNKRNCAW